jgi:predicted transcriptional regulator
VLLISIHPEFVEKIFAGQKRVEVRRRRPKLNNGDVIAIYATAPRCELVGLTRVVEVHESTPLELWDSVAADAAIDRGRYDRYFAGSKTAIGIVLEDPRPFPRPATLGDLRQIWPGFHPPQGFCYLKPEQTAFVDGLRQHRSVAA